MTTNMIPGSRWFRSDLHVHGLGSADYGDKSDTAETWLRAAIDAGLHCVALTDHNTGDWIDEVQRALEDLRRTDDVDLVLFPGVEVTVEGGWHLLVIFDPSCDSTDIVSFLATAGLPRQNQGDTSKQAGSYRDVLAAAERHGCAVILAHANDRTGLLLETSGQTTLDVLLDPGIHATQGFMLLRYAPSKIVFVTGSTAKVVTKLG